MGVRVARGRERVLLTSPPTTGRGSFPGDGVGQSALGEKVRGQVGGPYHPWA